MDTKFGTGVSNEMLQNARVTLLIVSELLRENQQESPGGEGVKITSPPPPLQIRVNLHKQSQLIESLKLWLSL